MKRQTIALHCKVCSKHWWTIIWFQKLFFPADPSFSTGVLALFSPLLRAFVLMPAVYVWIFFGNYTQSERCTCSYIKFWIHFNANYICVQWPKVHKKVCKCMSNEDASPKYPHLFNFNLKSWRQTNFLLISNQLSRFACCACRHPPPPPPAPPKYQMSELSLQFVEAIRNLNLAFNDSCGKRQVWTFWTKLHQNNYNFVPEGKELFYWYTFVRA